MPDQLNINGTDFLAYEKVGDLRSTAHELHGIPKPQGLAQVHGGRVQRVRASIGRRLVSLGSTVAGHHE